MPGQHRAHAGGSRPKCRTQGEPWEKDLDMASEVDVRSLHALVSCIPEGASNGRKDTRSRDEPKRAQWKPKLRESLDADHSSHRVVISLAAALGAEETDTCAAAELPAREEKRMRPSEYEWPIDWPDPDEDQYLISVANSAKSSWSGQKKSEKKDPAGEAGSSACAAAALPIKLVKPDPLLKEAMDHMSAAVIASLARSHPSVVVQPVVVEPGTGTVVPRPPEVANAEIVASAPAILADQTTGSETVTIKAHPLTQIAAAKPTKKPYDGAGVLGLFDDSDSDLLSDYNPPKPLALPQESSKPEPVRFPEENKETSDRPHIMHGLCECLLDAASCFQSAREFADEHWVEMMEYGAMAGTLFSTYTVVRAATHVTQQVATSGAVAMLVKVQIATPVWQLGSFVAAVAAMLYGVGCAASIWGYAMASTRCDPGGSVFTGTQTSPFCANCCKDSEVIFRPKEKSDVQCKHFMMPARCEGCAYYPGIYGHVLKTIWVSAATKTSIEEYGQLNKARNRSIHQSLTITLAHSGEWDPKNDWILFHLEHINNLERKYSLFWHDKLAYRMATPWHTEGEFETTDTERPSLKRMRQLWSWVEDHHGQLPQQTIVGGDMNRAEELMGNVKDPATAARTKEVFHPKSSTYVGVLDAERCAAIDGVDKLDTAVVAKPNAVKIGPILGVPQIHSHGDTLTKVAVAEKRTKPNKEYQPQSATAQRVRRFWYLLDKNHFTTSNMRRAYTELFGDCSLEEILRKKFSEKQIMETIEAMEVSDGSGKDISKRKANVKFEVTAKPKKAPRGVIDNGIELLALNVVAGHLFEYLIMNKGLDVASVEVDGKPNDKRRIKPRGFLHANNIKGEAREHVLDRLLREYAQATKEETCCFEVDQTGMEIHERYNKYTGGLLHGPYKILQKIHEFLMRRHESRLSHLHHAKIYFDAQHGMRYKFVLGGKNGFNLTAKFPDLPMDSGWLLTSVINAINEFAATFCCFCANPDELFTKTKNPQGFFELHIMKGDHHWTFTSVPLKCADGTYRSFKILWKMKVEGDDGAGLTARILAEFENYKIIEANYAELGLDSKLKLIVNGRLEFIGAHMLVKDGKTDVSFPWSPAISRSMLKLGTIASSEITEQAMIARSLSLAYMFAGRVNALCMVFLYQADARIQALKKKGISDLTTKVQAYSSEQYAFDVEAGTVLSLSDLFERTVKKCQVACPPVEVQCRMLTISYECDSRPFKAKDLADLQYVANNYVEIKDEDEEAWLMLPHQMK